MSDAKENVHRGTKWLDDKLASVLGPAPAGPFESTENEDANPGVVDQLCPVCHHALSRHTEEREPGSNRLFRRCPDGTVIETEISAETGLEGPDTQDGPILS